MERKYRSYGIPGLKIYKNYLTEEQEQNLIEHINSEPQIWNNDLERRTQQYGYKYDYGARRLTDAPTIPAFLIDQICRLIDDGLMISVPDQCIINEYTPGQGISPHIDHPLLFDDEIASISLGSPCIMEFNIDGDAEERIYLRRRSLLVMKGEARSKYKHSIPARTYDCIDGVRYKRETRISITFRTIKK